jgi:hypothetical protein
MFANRSVSTVADGSNQTYGVDGSFSFFTNLSLAGYYAETRTLDITDDDRSWLGGVNWVGDLLGGSVTHLRVGEGFNPEVGFLRRRGFRETPASARYSPRPQSIDWIRRLSFQTSLDYLEHVGEQVFLESRQVQGRFQLELESSDLLDVVYTDSYEFLEESFRIPGGGGVAVPVGGYDFSDVEVSVGLGLQRWYSGTVSVQRGSFYSGDKTTVGLRTGRVNVSERLSLEPTLSFNWVDLPEGSFRSDLAVTRVNYAFSPRMFFGGLVQYNSGTDSFSTNLRLRWEYRPGSELFVVYTEARNTDVLDGLTELSNRGFTVKLNYLLRP